MIRLHVTAEGQTEKAFVNKVLNPHLANYGVYADARCVLTSKDKRAAKEYRGGLISYQKARADINTWMKQDAKEDSWFTTMFDLYRLPADFPGYEQSKSLEPYSRVAALEQALYKAVSHRQFIPYIQPHEFEALILADPVKLDWEYLEHDKAIKRILEMVGSQNPELINDNPDTAPSKRILKEIPEYDKVSSGVAVVEHIGLQALRGKCPHFNDWVTRLERLGIERG